MVTFFLGAPPLCPLANHASEEPGPGASLIRVTRGGAVMGDARTINEVKAVLARHGGPEIAEFGE
ncbi:hypothetical protein ACWCXH_36565 [Kitasatospora sp. NPDC001660]